MTSSKKILKISIILVLFVFLLSSALISVLYLGGTKTTPEAEDIVADEMITESSIEDAVVSNE